MVFDTLKQRMGGKDQLNPMQIAHHTLFTAREKIDLLNQLKAEATGAQIEGDPVAFRQLFTNLLVFRMNGSCDRKIVHRLPPVTISNCLLGAVKLLAEHFLATLIQLVRARFGRSGIITVRLAGGRLG